MKKIILFLLLPLVFTACQKKDINALKSEINDLKNRVSRLEDAAKTLNTDIASLKTIATALQAKVSVVSYTAIGTGYELVMSDGSKINLNHGNDGANGTNGRDGINAPVIGLKQDADGNYYWTIGGDWLLQNGQKVKANGTNGTNGTNGASGITPLLMVNATSNQWMVSYDNGNTWSVIKDGSGNPVTATGAQGPQGQPGAQGPGGVAGFSITETDAAVIITYGGTTYTLPKGSSTPTPNEYKMVLVTTLNLDQTIGIGIDAEPADRADVWIDLNNDKKMDAGEKVNRFGANTTNFYQLSSSQTVTIYGKVTLLGCSGNWLTALDLSKNTALTKLFCIANQLSTLDLSKNTALTELYCNANQLSTLDLSKNTALTVLHCNSNQLSTLDLSKNTSLTVLHCGSNQLSALDLSKNTALTQLFCTFNQLSALDLSKNAALAELYCHSNKLNALDLPKSTALIQVLCQNNQLSTLDLSQNTALIQVLCQNNQLSALDLSQNTVLIEVRCNNNKIKNANMAALINSLSPRNAANNALVFLYSEMPTPAEGNTVPTAADIDAAKAKKWTPYKLDDLGFQVAL